MPPLPDHMQPRLGEILRDELHRYPWSAQLEAHYERLIATDAAILEKLDGSQAFSSALWDLCFPRATQSDLWHYTTLAALQKIVKTREIWLHSLSKRLGEGELSKFATEFDYRGLLDLVDGLPQAHRLAKDLFYLSLTDSDDPGDMWNFGEVRLRLRVLPVLDRAHLRTMAYHAGSDHPLRVLRDFSRGRFGRAFVPWQVSRQGSFLLDSYFSWESEVRLLVKRFPGSTDLETRQSEGLEAIAIPLGAPNERARIELLAVEAETAQCCLEAEELLRLASDLEVQARVYKP